MEGELILKKQAISVTGIPYLSCAMEPAKAAEFAEHSRRLWKNSRAARAAFFVAIADRKFDDAAIRYRQAEKGL